MTFPHDWLHAYFLETGISVQNDEDLTEKMDWEDLEELLVYFSNEFQFSTLDIVPWYHDSQEGLWQYDPSELVEHIPITPITLIKSAEAGRWIIRYPRTELPTPVRRPFFQALWIGTRRVLATLLVIGIFIGLGAAVVYILKLLYWAMTVLLA